jgi:hypothetical protein
VVDVMIDTREPKWWQRFDITEDLVIDGNKITDASARAFMLADMIYGGEDDKLQRCYDEIYADILRMESRLN